ncbi:COA8 family protein CG14806, mitochondrial [Sergentomyia squamirostris]
MLRKIRLNGFIRMYTSAVESKESSSLKEPPSPNLINTDFVGPPDKISNLRLVVRHIPKNETPLQQRLRLRQIEIEEYNQKFWSNHNTRFFAERDEFIAAHKSHPEDSLSADQMSVFYKAFLDKNWKIHFYYNISWYIKNISLMILAFRVELARMGRIVRKSS